MWNKKFPAKSTFLHQYLYQIIFNNKINLVFPNVESENFFSLCWYPTVLAEDLFFSTKKNKRSSLIDSYTKQIGCPQHFVYLISQCDNEDDEINWMSSKIMKILVEVLASCYHFSVNVKFCANLCKKWIAETWYFTHFSLVN